VTVADTARVPRVAWLQLGATVVLFGLTWPAIKIGLSASTPCGWPPRGRRYRRSPPSDAGRAQAPRVARPRRLADRAVGRRLPAHLVLRLRHSRRAERPAGPLGLLAYTTMLWMVPLSLMSASLWAGAAWPAPCSAFWASSC